MRAPRYWLAGDPVQVRVLAGRWQSGGRVVLVHDTGTAVIGWKDGRESIENVSDLRPDVGDVRALAEAVGFIAWGAYELKPEHVDTLAAAQLALRCLAGRR